MNQTVAVGSSLLGVRFLEKKGTNGNRVDSLMLRGMEAIRDLPGDEREDHLASIALALGTLAKSMEEVSTAAMTEV